MRPLLVTLIAAPLAIAFACSPAKKPPKVVAPPEEDAGVVDAAIEEAAPPTLFERIGGKEALAGVVEQFLELAVADARLTKLFDKVKKDKERAKKLREALVEQLCTVTGGPCTYSQEMKAVHKDMKISDAQFDAFIADFKTALTMKSVAEPEANELLAKLTEMKAEIVPEKKK